METKYQTSFIPKKPVLVSQTSSFGSMSLFLLVSIIVFLVSLGLSGYVFLSKQILIKQIEAAQASIGTNKNGLKTDSTTIESLVELDSRTNVAEKLLNAHIAVSPIFDFLQRSTLKNIRFKNFNFSSGGKDKSGANSVSIQLSGVAKDWETVAYQADEFGKPDWRKIISEPKIYNLSLNSDGSVSFSFSARVASDFLVYKNNTNN